MKALFGNERATVARMQLTKECTKAEVHRISDIESESTGGNYECELPVCGAKAALKLAWQ